MTHRPAARLHAWLTTVLSVIATRLRAAPQRGQGTVEYVALMLLVAGVLAAAVGVAASGGNKLQLAEAVGREIKEAVGVAGSPAPAAK